MVKLELVSIIVVNILANISYSILVPFLPIEFDKYGIHVSVYGYIFAMYALAVMVGSPIVGKALTKYGRKIILILGLLWMGVAMIGFGMITLLYSQTVVIIVALILRTFQGLASGLIQTTSYAIVAVTYPENQQKYLGILEASMGFGLVIGPIIGSSLYSLLAFSGTFYLTGSVFIVSAIILLFVIPKTVDRSDETQRLTDTTEIAISYKDVLSQRIFLCTAIAAFFAYFAYSFLEPVLAVRLMEKGVKEFWIGAFFCLNAVGYISGSLLVSKFAECWDNKILIVIGMFWAGISEFLVGPSLLLPDSLWVMGAGQVTLGFFVIFFTVTSLPEMINEVKRKYPDKQFEASDISSGVFNSMLGLGQMLSPLYGSYMTEAFGFRFCADTVGYLLLIYCAAYFILCVGCSYLKGEKDAFKRPDAVSRISARDSVFEAFGTRSVSRKGKRKDFSIKLY